VAAGYIIVYQTYAANRVGWRLCMTRPLKVPLIHRSTTPPILTTQSTVSETRPAIQRSRRDDRGSYEGYITTVHVDGACALSTEVAVPFAPMVDGLNWGRLVPQRRLSTGRFA